MSGAADTSVSGLRPTAVACDGATMLSTVSKFVGDSGRSTRKNDDVPVRPVEGLPERSVTPGTGTRSKLNSVDPKKCSCFHLPPAYARGKNASMRPSP